jgi:hypothetical protein
MYDIMNKMPRKFIPGHKKIQKEGYNAWTIRQPDFDHSCEPSVFLGSRVLMLSVWQEGFEILTEKHWIVMDES